MLESAVFIQTEKLFSYLKAVLNGIALEHVKSLNKFVPGYIL